MPKKIEFNVKNNTSSEGADIFNDNINEPQTNTVSNENLSMNSSSSKTQLKRVRIFVDLEPQMIKTIDDILIEQLKNCDPTLKRPTRTSVIKDIFLLGLNIKRKNNEL